LEIRLKQRAGHLLCVQIERARLQVNVVLKCYGEAGLLRSGTIVGEIKALRDQGVDVSRSAFAGARANAKAF
jgi:hypothetical protein